MGEAPNKDRGFVFAASGDKHIRMALYAAKSVKRIHPDIPVDLFGNIVSGTLPHGHPFDRVHPLRRESNRPKFEALIHTRFARTLYLDNDTRLVAAVDDVFDLLKRFDVVAAQDPLRNSAPALTQLGPHLPAAFPQLQGGVIGRSNTDRAKAFIESWHQAFLAGHHAADQPSLRVTAWEDKAMRLAVLPEEYNLFDTWTLLSRRPMHTAPRIIHSRRFKTQRALDRAASDTATAQPLKDPTLPLVLGRLRLTILRALLTEDRTLNPSLVASPAPRSFNTLQLLKFMGAALRELPVILTKNE